MKHVNYTCDFCGVVMTEEQDKHHIQALSTKSESMSAWGVLKEWQHVCGPCYLHMESKFKSMKSINVQVTNEVLLERALNFASMTILNYQNYCDMSQKLSEEEVRNRHEYLRYAREYEKKFKEAIEEIKSNNKNKE